MPRKGHIWLVFKKIYIFTHSFPGFFNMLLFLHSCFGCPVVEGYGMTETSCVVSSMDEHDVLSGHVGSPNPACGELLS